MLKRMVVAGRSLAQSDPKPDPPTGAVVYTLTDEKDLSTERTTLEGKAVLLEEIKLECACSGSIGSDTYKGDGKASIAAKSARVTCEGHQLLLLGDKVTVNCTGTTKSPSGATTPNVKASVTVTISDAAQTTGLANDS
jgi:hypothetical protein